MVINDNEHMSNHPAKFWPVFGKNRQFFGTRAKNGRNPKSAQNPLKTKKSAQNKYEHKPH